MVSYDWTPGFPSRKVNPQAAGEFLETLRERKDGYLDAMDVVDAARTKRSPIHRLFEWDDDRAATEHRLEQARSLLRSIVVVTTDDQEEERSIRAFVTVTKETGRHYTSMVTAMGDEEMREQVLARAFREMEQFEKRYHDLVEFSLVFKEVKKIRRKHRKRRVSA